jgi:hypothetical protein
VERHEKVWHSPRKVWSCPTRNDVRAAAHFQTGALGQYLYPNPSGSDVCPFCGEQSEVIFEDLDEDIHKCFGDWDIRLEHLDYVHNFDKCQPPLKFYNLDRFLLHLAGSHNLQLSVWTKEAVDSCMREKHKVSDIMDIFAIKDDNRAAQYDEITVAQIISIDQNCHII